MTAISQNTKANHTRQLTICRKWFPRAYNGYTNFPIISLSGKWLRDMGFKSGQVISIACEDRRLVITVAKENKFCNDDVDDSQGRP